MAMTYNDWLQACVTILNIQDPFGATAFTTLAPRFIAYAENRLYRKFDFLATRVVDNTKKTTGGLRAVALPSNFVVVEGVSLVTPADTTAVAGTRIPLVRGTRQLLDVIWPQESATQAPDPLNPGYWALFSEQEANPAPGSADEPTPLPSAILISPTPDGEYTVEISGTQRPTALSATNQTTFLTTYCEEVFLCATIIMAALYQRDFGVAAPDQGLSGKYESQYQLLAHDLDLEELRKKSLSSDASTLVPNQASGGPPQQQQQQRP